MEVDSSDEPAPSVSMDPDGAEEPGPELSARSAASMEVAGDAS